jgi:GNAT superfamily N-acetyltransferase
MDLVIRPFSSDDYSAIVGIFNAISPDSPTAVEEIRYFDEHREPRYRFGRIVAESGGEVVGVAQFDQPPWMYHPRKFYVDVSVLPARHGQGTGRALYERLLSDLRPFDPLTIRAVAREDRERAVRFLRDRDFAEEMRGWESRLDVKTFDLSPYTDVEERVRAQGIAIRTLRELEAEPDYRRRIYELDMELEADVPQPEAFTRPSFEEYSAHFFENPNLLPEGVFVAVDAGEFVGTTSLWAMQASSDLNIGLTAVKRHYRRRGIALALKLRAIDSARAHGVTEMDTTNDSHNIAMLHINQALGFKREPAWVVFEKHFPVG